MSDKLKIGVLGDRKIQLELLEQLRESAENYGGALIITSNGWDYVDNHLCYPNDDMTSLLDRSKRAVALHELAEVDGK